MWTVVESRATVASLRQFREEATNHPFARSREYLILLMKGGAEATGTDQQHGICCRTAANFANFVLAAITEAGQQLQ